MKYIVYKLTAPNGNAYIGVTKRSIEVRWGSHVSDAVNGSPLPLHGAIRKYGPEAFTREILTECVDARELKIAERALISEHGTYVRTGHGYNCTMGGDGNWGWKPTKATRQKWREQRKGQLANNPEWLARTIAARKNGPKPPFTESHRRNMSLAKKGKKLSPQHREKIRLAGIGRKWTEEQRVNHRAATKGRKRNPESVAKMAATKRGKKMSPEHAAAARLRLAEIRERRKGIPMSDEQRAKISASAKARLSTPEARAEMVKRLEKGARKRYLPESIERQRKMMMGNKNTLGRKIPQEEIDRRIASMKKNRAAKKLAVQPALFALTPRNFNRPLWWKEWL